ncbi:cell envelope biogenesis protein OmpA [Spirochaetia bacterium]|nr:cell envelope biogenesis protein OmpA [Spirochaetia bacterium]
MKSFSASKGSFKKSFASMCFFCIFCALVLSNIYADDWTLTERSDFSRHDNGKYIGHVYREVRTSMKQSGNESQGFIPYKANFIVLEETKTDMRASAKPVDVVITTNLKMTKTGNMQIENDKGYPSLRNFPVYSLESIKKGEMQEGFTWIAEGKRAVVDNDDKTIVYPFLAEYTYKGREDYKGIQVHHITARYASNFVPNAFESETLKSIMGKHDVDILLSVETGMLVMQRDKLDETFSWTNGNTTRYNGFSLTFGTGLPAVDKPSIITSIKSTKDIDVEQVENGLRLRIKDLRFKSDSDELLPGEEVRLDSIAKTLQGVKDRTFLVEGHTAAITNGSDEMELSVKRAQRIVGEMQKRNIPASRFVYKGYGGTKPVGDNSTDDGRKLNRRVEITILD